MMRQFAVIKNADTDEIFAIAIKGEDNLTHCLGIHPAGRQWAKSYNRGLTKSLTHDLQPGIVTGDFAPLTSTMQAVIDEAMEGKSVRFPDRSRLVFIDSIDHRHTQVVPQVKDAGLHSLTLKDLKKGADYKGMTFRVDSARSSVLFKTRQGQYGYDIQGIGFISRKSDKKVLQEELTNTALGYGNVRRAVKAVAERKCIMLDGHDGYIPLDEEKFVAPVRTKANRLGRRIGGRGLGGRGRGGGGGIRKIGRSMQDPFDPKAWDGDGDGFVQEGTMWERPSIPGINTNLPGQPKTRTKPKDSPDDTQRERKRRADAKKPRRDPDRYRPGNRTARRRGVIDAQRNNPGARVTSGSGMRSRGNDPWDEGPGVAAENGLDALMDRIDNTPLGELYDQVGDGIDGLGNVSNRLLDELITEHGWDVEEGGVDLGKTLDELLPGRGRTGDTRSKFLASVEDDFWDDPSRFMDIDEGPDPYDVARDRQMDDDARGGMRSFREFDRSVRRNAPYGTPEGDRERREDKEEYDRLVQFLMDDSQERADLMARLYPERSPEDLHDYYKVLSREEAIEELRRLGSNARVLGTGPGSPLGELRKRTAEKHRSRFGAGGAGYGMRSMHEDYEPDPMDLAKAHREDRLMREHTAHLTSDELIQLNETLAEVLAVFEGSIYGPDEEDPDFARILKLKEAIEVALDAQDVIEIGDGMDIDDTIGTLLRVYDGVGEPWPEISDVISVLEMARDNRDGEYVSPTLTERGYMLSDEDRAVDGGMRSRRGGEPSRRETPRRQELRKMSVNELRDDDSVPDEALEALENTFSAFPPDDPIFHNPIEDVIEDSEPAMYFGPDDLERLLDIADPWQTVDAERNPKIAARFQRGGMRSQRTERDEMLDILDAEPERLFAELRKVDDKQIVAWAKAAGIYDHRKSLGKMRRELAGLSEPVPGNIDDKLQFPGGRAEWEKRNRVPHLTPGWRSDGMLSQGGMRSQRGGDDDRAAMLQILNAEPERLFAKLRKVDDKQIVAWAKAAGIYDHRKSLGKMRRELAGLPPQVPGNIDDKLQFPGGRAEWEKRNRVPHLTPGWRSDGMLSQGGMRSQRGGDDDRAAMLQILNAEPERLFAKLRKVDDKQIVAWAKAAGIYDHRKSLGKMRRELAGLPPQVPGNIDDKLQFPGGRAEWEKRNRVPHLTPGWRSDGMLSQGGMRSQNRDIYGPSRQEMEAEIPKMSYAEIREHNDYGPGSRDALEAFENTFSAFPDDHPIWQTPLEEIVRLDNDVYWRQSDLDDVIEMIDSFEPPGEIAPGIDRAEEMGPRSPRQTSQELILEDLRSEGGMRSSWVDTSDMFSPSDPLYPAGRFDPNHWPTFGGDPRLNPDGSRALQPDGRVLDSRDDRVTSRLSKLSRVDSQRTRHAQRTGADDSNESYRWGERRVEQVRRGGMRARQRDAATDAAAMPRGRGGMQSRRRPDRGRNRPGLDRASKRDGQIWENLTPEERKAVVEAAKVEMHRLMWGLTWNDIGVKDTRKSGAEGVSNIGNAVIRYWFNEHIRPGLSEEDAKNYVFTDENIEQIRSVMDRAVSDGLMDPITAESMEKLLNRFDSLRTYRNMATASEEDGDEAFAFLEHLSPSARDSLYKRAAGPDQDRLRKRAALGWNKNPSTRDESLESRQGEVGRLAGTRRGRVGSWTRDMAKRIMIPDPERARRRALKAQKKRGGSGGGFTREQRRRSAIERAMSKARRKARSLLRGKKDEKKILAEADKNMGHKVVKVDADGNVTLGDIKQFSKALKAYRREKDALKVKVKKGSGEELGEDIADARNRDLAIMWEVHGMNGLPILVSEAELTALIDEGWTLMSRGHGHGKGGADNAENWLTDELRFLPGSGGQAYGPGEYWSTEGDWGGFRDNDSENTTVGVIPPTARVIKQSDTTKEAGANKRITEVFDLVGSTYPGDEIEHADPKELAAQIRAEFDKADARNWETEVGKVWQRLLEAMENGDPDSVNAMLMFKKISRAEANLIAPALGYDIIDAGSVQLVMNRSVIVALDGSVNEGGFQKFNRIDREARADRRER